MDKGKGSSLARIHFFTKIVKKEEWKKSMAGKNEDSVIRVILGLGYVENIDFYRQYPIGERFVIDVAFKNEQVAVEVDGENHKRKEQAALDRKRDSYLKDNNWVSIRVKDKEFFGYKGSFYKSLIKQIVEERREQYQKGILYPIEIPRYVNEDYE